MTLAQAASERDVPLHADPGLMAQPGRNLVLNAAGKVLSDESFTSVKQLREQSDAFIDDYTSMPGRSSGPNPKSTKKNAF